MSEIITISHAELTARQVTYDAIQSAHCHITWVPEFIDLALSRFPGYTLSALVDAPAFLQGCAAILTSEYKQPGLAVTGPALTDAGCSPEARFLNAYLTREVGHCLNEANLEILDHQKVEDCRSIVFTRFVRIMAEFEVGWLDGLVARPSHCASYCGRSMLQAINDVKDLLFGGQRKDYREEAREGKNADGTVFDPTDAVSQKRFDQSVRDLRKDWDENELRIAIDKSLARSRDPAAVRALITGELTPKDVAALFHRTLPWVTTCLLNPFIADVQQRLVHLRVASRGSGKTDIRLLRKHYPKCFLKGAGISAVTTWVPHRPQEPPSTDLPFVQ